MIKRNAFMNKLFKFKDKMLIKIVTGIRRCGKSTLLKMYSNELIELGVNSEQIIFINFEDLDYEELTDYKKLYDYIKNRLIEGKQNYIFLDEIQHVKDFQKVVDSLFIKENCDVYITGSNAYFLSSELATLLSGRYVTIEMLPLSFKEYQSAFSNNNSLAKNYQKYITSSSFPYATIFEEKDQIRQYLDGIYNTVVLKDIIARKGIKDVSSLENVIKYMADNIGNITSVKKICDTIVSSGKKIAYPTVENYIDGLCDSFIFYKTNRYDIKGKQHLKTLEKYYLCDVGLRYYLLGSKNVDMGRILENIVYLELIRRDYDVYIGKIDTKEVDFIAIKNGETSYYQVSLTTRDENTLKRELRSLEMIKDHNQKYLLTLDEDPLTSYNGIKKLNALEWLVL